MHSPVAVSQESSVQPSASVQSTGVAAHWLLSHTSRVQESASSHSSSARQQSARTVKMHTSAVQVSAVQGSVSSQSSAARQSTHSPSAGLQSRSPQSTGVCTACGWSPAISQMSIVHESPSLISSKTQGLNTCGQAVTKGRVVLAASSAARFRRITAAS